MDTHGFEITQGMDKRPYEIVDQYGTVHDLSRQLNGIRQGAVSKYLNDIRSELRPTAEASQDRRRQHAETQQPEPIADLRDLTEAQELANAMLQSRERARADQGDARDTESEPPPVQSYSFKFEQSLTPQPKPKRDHITEKQDLAAAMIEHARQRERAEPETTLQQVQETAREQTAPKQDNTQPQKYINPVTGQEMTADAYQRLQARIEEQKQREAERQSRDKERKHQHRR